MDGHLNPDSPALNPAPISAGSLRTICEACPYPIAKVDRDWKIAYINAAARDMLFGGEYPVGSSYCDVFRTQGQQQASCRDRYAPAMEKGSLLEFVDCFTAPLNRWMSVTVRPLPDGMVVFFRDVTAERQAVDALVKTERLSSLGRLTSAIAHEIRNPLESITNLLYLAQESREIDDLKGYLALAEKELRRASSIVSQTLRFNRTNVVSLVSCDVLVREILLLQKARLLSARIETDTRLSETAQVFCREGEVRQILVNLIVNAIDAMYPNGGRLMVRIRKSIRKTVAGVVITIADTGIGMSHSTLARSFDPFFTTKSDQGNGLGLWISRELAGRHGGTLKARSSQRNGRSGSVFQLFLPAAPIAPPQVVVQAQM